MKVVSLNTWGGRINDSLLAFVRDRAASTHIFCLQEVLSGGYGKTPRGEMKSGFEDISASLPDHTGYFFEYGEGGYYSESLAKADFKYGIACFVRKGLKQSFGGGATLYDLDRTWSDYSGRFAAGTSMAVLVEDYVIVNVHGMWQGSIKEDTEAKLEQSKKILELANMFAGKRIICGDFNLLPHTKSIQMIADKYANLIDQYRVTDTRGPLYSKELRYSDYMFTDPLIKVDSFEVPAIEVSDHLPLIMDVT